MKLAGIGFSAGVSPQAAAREAVEAALEGCGSAQIDVSLVFATTAWGPRLGELLAEVEGRLDAGIVAGASVSGLFAGGSGTSQNPGIAVLALSGVQAEGAVLDGLSGVEERSAAELLERFRDAPGPDDLVLFFADSASLAPDSAFAGVAEMLGSSTVLGLGASALPGAGSLVWCDGEPVEQALAGIVLRGVGRPRWGLAHAGRPLSGPRTVTRSRSHWVKSLDDRRATEVFEAAARECGITDSREARQQLVVSIDRGRPDSGDACSGYALHELRDIVGLDPSQGSIALPLEVPVGSKLTFVLKDQVAARESLETLVEAHSDVDPLFGLYLSTDGRALAATARCLQVGFPKVPILGLEGAYPLAAPEGRGVACRALNHCSVLALIER
jgi:small ligand-binding sensory domain FIST